MELILERLHYINSVLHYPFMIEIVIVGLALGLYVSNKMLHEESF